jgi:hypothetical protein
MRQLLHGSNSTVAHSITSSAVARGVVGKVRPSVFAVLRLMTNSELGRVRLYSSR